MKIQYYLLAVILCISSTSFAQQANFQGKIYSNGIPINGQHNIQFLIGPPLNWSSLPTPIQVTNGLYSTVITFPGNIFDENHSSRQMVVYVDGNIIDTVTIFAPIERDPMVRSYIKDSITWQDIHDKPTIDTSFSNEYQTLTIKNDTLLISNGNSVRLPGISTVYGNFKSVDTTIQTMVEVPTPGTSTCNGSINESILQSFYATNSGKLRQLILPVAVSSTCNSITVYFYEGTGTGGQSLGHKSFTVSNTLTTQILDLSSGINSSSTGSLDFAVGKTYTFLITPASGCFASVSCNSSNPYLYGLSSLGSNTDIAFALNIDHSSPANLSVNKNGNVGIGLDSATAKLEVKGRIKDQTGFVMPVGTIIAYSGRNVPEGWLLCDGRPINRSVYQDLYNAIDTSWGKGDGSSTFNLPDLRGRFLRGVDNSPTEGSANIDPDKTIRSASKAGGNTGNNVGTVQGDAYKSHTHGIYGPYYNISTSGGGGHYSILTQRLYQSDPSGGNETRPSNAYVYYMVKY